ncbi:MAG: hypothetical protein ACJAZS_000759 [Alteromonas naphthalenivorans]|jgi:hypothetical protein
MKIKVLFLLSCITMFLNSADSSIPEYTLPGLHTSEDLSDRAFAHSSDVLLCMVQEGTTTPPDTEKDELVLESRFKALTEEMNTKFKQLIGRIEALEKGIK